MLALVNLKKHSLMHCTSRQPVLTFVNKTKLLTLTFYAYHICEIDTQYLNINFSIILSNEMYTFFFFF